MKVLSICMIILLQQLAGNNNNSIVVKGFQISSGVPKHSHLSSRCKPTIFSSSPSTLFAKNNKVENNVDEFIVGEQLPNINNGLIYDANEVLCWEQPTYEEEDDDVSWEDGDIWKKTRVELLKLWILPRNSSTGVWEAFLEAEGAKKGELREEAFRAELRLLQKMPQLLRLPTEQVVDSANTLLKTLKMPPALLRQEPVLLSIPPFLLEKAFETILLEHHANSDDNDSESEYYLNTLHACRDNPGLLAETALRVFIDL